VQGTHPFEGDSMRARLRPFGGMWLHRSGAVAGVRAAAGRALIRPPVSRRVAALRCVPALARGLACTAGQRFRASLRQAEPEWRTAAAARGAPGPCCLRPAAGLTLLWRSCFWYF